MILRIRPTGPRKSNPLLPEPPFPRFATGQNILGQRSACHLSGDCFPLLLNRQKAHSLST